MNQNQYPYNQQGSTYQTGSTRPPKSRGGLIAFLLVVVILLLGAVTLLGAMNVKLFKELAETEGITIIMTTHDPGLMDLGDRVYELQDGEVIYGE